MLSQSLLKRWFYMGEKDGQVHSWRKKEVFPDKTTWFPLFRTPLRLLDFISLKKFKERKIDNLFRGGTLINRCVFPVQYIISDTVPSTDRTCYCSLLIFVPSFLLANIAINYISKPVTWLASYAATFVYRIRYFHNVHFYGRKFFLETEWTGI